MELRGRPGAERLSARNLSSPRRPHLTYAAVIGVLRRLARATLRWTDRATQQMVRRLDRRALRWILKALGSAIVSARTGHACRVTPLGDGLLAHRYRDGTTVHPTFRGLSPSRMRRETLDTFCWQYVPKRGDVVLDVGAGIGEEAITFSRLVESAGRVVSIEAHPSTYHRLVLTCALNDLENVTPLQFAIADTEGERRIEIGRDDMHVGSTLTASGGVAVPATTLDALTRKLGIEHIDLLKMNIEGAERLAIGAMAATLRRTRHVVISCHDFLVPLFGVDPKDFATFSRVRAYLETMGFEVVTRADDRRPWIPFYLYGSRIPR